MIIRARERADRVLAAARAKTDRHSSVHTPEAVAHERDVEDRAVQKERVRADDTVRAERAEHVAELSLEREETDRDLSNERERADTALATRDEFMGIVSHDLRNMLNLMILYAGLIADGAALEARAEQVVEYARRIKRSGDRMNRLIGDLVDVASIEAGALAVTRELADPSIVVMESVDAFHAQAAAAGISLVADIAQPCPHLLFDPARLLQVLTNLLSNALKFTTANGKVVVRVEVSGAELRFAISDTGIGIPPDKLEAVFERFLQITKHDRRGLGLGLYISKCIVQGHGGRIWAESKLGEGSTFYFTLPLTAPARPADA
ncbi:MAG TPA: HAMP domain-containing sensor histidine kinase [Polyangiales bacterium]